MVRTFRESPKAESKFLKLCRQNGMISILLGSSLILILLALNLYAIVALRESPIMNMEAILQPPASASLQRLLDRSTSTIKDVKWTSNDSQIENDDWGLSFELEEVSSPLPGKLSSNGFLSRPSHNATVNREYRYEPHIKKNISEKIQFSFLLAPSGMTIDNNTGSVRWTATPEQSGEHKVRIQAKSSSGAVYIQDFKLIVSNVFHPLGTDSRGFDILEGLFRGARSAILPAFVAVAVMIGLGVLFGALAGYYGGFIAWIVFHVTKVIDSFPRLVLIFMVVSIFQINIYLIMFFVGLIYFPQVASLIKEKISLLKQQQFIEAARELGLSDIVIIFKHILWYNCRPILFSQIAIGFAIAILLEVTLSYLQFGVQGPIASWGEMLNANKHLVTQDQYWPIVFPALAIVFSIIGFFTLGNGLNRYFSIKEGDV